VEWSNNDLYEKRLGASHGSKGKVLSDTAKGSPVNEIGYNQFQFAKRSWTSAARPSMDLRKSVDPAAR
jgi:hypothetical protein